MKKKGLYLLAGRSLARIFEKNDENTLAILNSVIIPTVWKVMHDGAAAPAKGGPP